jgi:hypothetical protein
MPVGAALTTTPNTFAGNQTVNGNLILGGTGAIQFPDGTTQATAATSASSGVPSGFTILGTSTVAPPGYTASGSITTGEFWLSLTPMPVGLAGLGVAAANGNVYAMGGGSRILDILDTNTGIWSQGAAMPTPITGLAVAAFPIQQQIYAIGGLQGVVSNSVQVYSYASDAWTTGPSMNEARIGLAAVGISDATNPTVIGICALGGNDGTAGPNGYLHSMECTSGGIWGVKPGGMQTGRAELAAEFLNNKIYAIGGSDGTSDLGTVEVYDLLSNRWSTAAPMPTPRRGLTAVAANGKIYAIGGVFKGTALSIVEVYDPSTNTWSLAAPMLTARGWLAGVGVNSHIYAIGGSASVPSISQCISGVCTTTYSVFPAVGGTTALGTVERKTPGTTFSLFTKN